MSRDSAGDYTWPSNSFNPAVAGTDIDPDDWNTSVTDVEAAVTESVYTAGLGATDNILLRTDGTNTKKAQGSPIACTDGGAVSGCVTITLTPYTVATLPTGAAGMIAFASDGRKNGEGGGAGTGVLVFHDGTAWRACDTGATAAA